MAEVLAWPFIYARGRDRGFQLAIAPDRNAGAVDADLIQLASAYSTADGLQIQSLPSAASRRLEAVFEMTYLTKRMVGAGGGSPGTPQSSSERALDRSGRPSQALVGLIVDLGREGRELEGASSECIKIALTRGLEALQGLWNSTDPVETARAPAFTLDSGLLRLSNQATSRSPRGDVPIAGTDKYDGSHGCGGGADPGRRVPHLRGLAVGILIIGLVAGGIAVWRRGEGVDPGSVGQRVCDALSDADTKRGYTTLLSLWQNTQPQLQAAVGQYVGEVDTCTVKNVQPPDTVQLTLSNPKNRTLLTLALSGNGKIQSIRSQDASTAAN